MPPTPLPLTPSFAPLTPPRLLCQYDDRAMIEALVATQYRIRRPIGSGGMAYASLAEGRPTRRQGARKILEPGRDSNVPRFEREAAAAGALSHPNIVAVYGTGRSGDTYYIAME